MSLRVIAGSARGHKIIVPDSNVRPTLDRVRQAAFNILQNEVPGCRFLDLFAGSGANGIEALSRGARRAVLTDKETACIRIIERNLAHTGLGANATVCRATFPDDLPKLRVLGPFDIIYLDPPHGFTEMGALGEGLARAGLLADGGTLVWEHASKGVDPALLMGFQHDRTTKYGGTALSIFS